MPDPEELERAVRRILDGIDRTEDSEGWWETSTGAKFGANKLAELLAALSAEGAQERWCSACKNMGVYRNRVTGERTSPCPSCGRGPAPEQPQGEPREVISPDTPEGR